MLKRLLRLIESVDRDQPIAEADLAAAAAELLLEIGRADFDLSQGESESVVSALKSQFGLSDAEAHACLDRALDAQGNRASLYPLTRLMNERLSAEEKVRLVERLWDIAHTDDRIDKHEEH